MSWAEHDRIADEMTAHRAAATAAEARTLTGDEVLQLRAALDATLKALRHINTKGLPYARRTEFEQAASALAAAQRLMAKSAQPL